ncbi:MAG: fibronectin type III domain-containing protein [Ignavibacteriales bacterium]
MPTPRTELSAVTSDGKIYAFGGYKNAYTTIYKVIEEYNPTTDTWTTKGMLPTARYGMGACELAGKIYLVGGEDGSGVKDLVEEFDPVENTCMTQVNMPTARYRLGVVSADNKMFAIGGSGTTIGKLEIFIPAISENLPVAPENVTTTSAQTQITINWGSVLYASGYDIEIDGTVIENGENTSYQDCDLLPNTSHTYRVRAKNIAGNGAWSNVITQRTLGEDGLLLALPAVPSNIRTTPGSTELTVTWDASEGAETYEIEVGGVIEDNGGSLSYSDTELAPNTQHTYRVRAKNEAGYSEWTSLISVYTLPGVTGLSATSTDSTITLAWGTVTDAIGYNIEVDGAVVDTGINTSYVHTNLSSGAQHIYRVRSITANGVGDWSAEIIKSTLPGTPQNLSAQSTYNSISLSWDSAVGAESYDIEVDGEIINNGPSTTYEHNGLEPNEQHSYRVRAKNSTDAGAWSALIEKKTILSMPIISSLTPTSSTITIKWNVVSDATDYEIEVNGNVIDNCSVTTYVYEGLLPNTTYTFRVMAIGSNNESEWSAAVTKSTLLSAPSNIVTSTASSTITISWNVVEDASGYDIEVDGEVVDNGQSTSYVHSGLTSGSIHTYRVRAKNANGKGDWSSAVTQTTYSTAPTIPTNVTATATNTSITIKWSTVSGAAGYDVEFDGQVSDSGNNTTYIKSGLTQNTQHTYRVRAKNSGGVSGWSTLSTKLTMPDMPDIPTIQSATPTNTTITVQWNTVSNATGYDIEADGVIINNGTSTQYAHTGLDPDSQHTFRVRARNASGKTSWSLSVTKSTLPNAPDVPANIVAASEMTSIGLAWDEVSGADSYDIQADNVLISGIQSTSYSHSGLKPDTEHTYKVRAVNSGGASDWSMLITESTLPNGSGIPTNLKASSTDTAITISWDEVDNATGYVIEIDGTTEESVTDAVYEHTNLAQGSEHTYRVKTITDNGQSDWSELLTKTTQPDTSEIPLNLTADATSTSIMVYWDSVDGADGYDIEIDGSDIESITDTTYEHTGLTPRTQHTYRVRSVISNEASGWSDVLTKSTLRNESIIPQNLTASATSTSITVEWDAVNGAEGYEIQLDDNDIETVTNTVYGHIGLLPNTLHTYRVRSLNSGGSSDWSNILLKTTLRDESNIPQGLSGTAQETSITLQWNPVENATGYQIEIDGNTIETVTDAVYIDEGLLPNTLHSYRVRTLISDTMSEWCNELTVCTFSDASGVPDNLNATAQETSITIAWDAVEGATGYDIEVDSVVIDNGTNTSYTHTGLLPGTRHTYRVRAKNDTFTSEWSATLDKVTALGIPANITTSPTNTTISLTWGTVSGATAYDIEIDGSQIETVTDAVYVHKWLIPETLHIYRIRAKTSVAVGQWSEIISASTVNNAYTVHCSQNKEFDFMLSAADIMDFDNYIFTVTYNPDDLEAVDLCGITSSEELAEGQIPDSDITITKYTHGTIEFRVNKYIADGMSWNGIANDIKFRTIKSEGTTVINYEMALN